MTRRNRFVIRNDFGRPLTLCLEPYGAFFDLSEGEEVSVCDAYDEVPSTVKLSGSGVEAVVVSIWPGDGDVRVEKGGIDLLDLVQDAAEV